MFKPMQLQPFFFLSSSVMAARTSGGNSQQASAPRSEPGPVILINASNAQRVEVGALTKVGNGTSAPPRTICGSINMMTIKGAELELGASAEANKPSIMPARVARDMVT